MKKIFAFDMGKASIGYCVREDNEIKELGSIIIDKDHSSVADNRKRRRTKRIIDSHRVREKWFDELWQNHGLNILDKSDERFKREFANKNDNTIYNSTLLRIALIQGRKLEEWQIYKALHNAFQRRGYDINIAWANGTDDEKENEEAVKKYCCIDGADIINSDEYKYPCYYDALLLGLWEENNPYELKRAIDLAPAKVRTSSRVAPRELVVKELTKLWEEAKKQLPQLEKISVEEFLYGDYREAYGSYKNPEWIQYRGTEHDWQGVLGQKIPRFDNRVIAKCRLLPKRNVCSADTIENITFTLLMQLKNLRFIDNETNEQRRLAPYEIKEIYENKLPDWVQKLTLMRKDKTKNPSFTVTKTDIENVIGKKRIKDKIEPFKANISGRSSFCRRAMQIMIDIIITGDNPTEIDISKYIDKKETSNGITEEEIKIMLSKIGDWNNLFISDNRDEMAQNAQNADIKSDILIGNITNPVVRNRLQIFKNLFNELISDGKPDEVIFEFVRDGADNSLFGSIKANENLKYQKAQEKENEQIIKELEEANADVKQYFLMHKLAKAQEFKCIYSGQKISPSDYPLCEIDHIYPRTLGGNDALYNKVVCFKNENQDKGGRTPYEWLFSDKERWAEYTLRVTNLKGKLGKKKASLLVLPPDKCEKLIDSYNGLAETAQVAKVASAITHYLCGWGMQTKDSQRHVFVENGSTTAKIRNIYKLNSLLGDDEKKNRDNPKHHALDAICISYARNLKLDEQKRRYYVEGLDRPYIEQKINELMPIPYTHKKPLKANTNPLETIYGKRIIDNKAYITSRVSLEDMKQDIKAIKNIIDTVIKDDLTSKHELKLPDSEWKNMLKNYVHPKKKTKVKKVLTIVSEGILETDLNGRERIGEYSDFGTKGTKGQFKHSKGHKGQILYYDKNGNVKVMPIFANKSTKEVKEKLMDMGCKLYNGGEVFYSGCLVEIHNDFKAGALNYPKGIYKLKSIWENGPAQIENNTGREILTSAKNLATAEFHKLKM